MLTQKTDGKAVSTALVSHAKGGRTNCELHQLPIKKVPCLLNSRSTLTRRCALRPWWRLRRNIAAASWIHARPVRNPAVSFLAHLIRAPVSPIISRCRTYFWIKTRAHTYPAGRSSAALIFHIYALGRRQNCTPSAPLGTTKKPRSGALRGLIIHSLFGGGRLAPSLRKQRAFTPPEAQAVRAPFCAQGVDLEARVAQRSGRDECETCRKR